jgi:PAS domain S-box-containing protein
MHTIALLDAVAILGWLCAGVAIVLKWGKGPSRHARLAFLAVAAFSLLHGACMFLEWSGVTSELENIEDILGATLPVWWAFSVYVIVAGLDRNDLRRSRERYALAQKAARIGSWEWDVKADIMRFSDEVEPMFGAPRGSFGATGEEFIRRAHPDDQRRLEAAIRGSLKRGAAFSIEHRIAWPDGAERWISQAGGAYCNGRGDEVRVLGIVRDVTDQIRAREDLVAQADTERMLLRELDHRVRNNLSSLLSVIRLTQERTDSIQDFAETIKSRTQAIAAVHSILSAGKWRGSTLDAMIMSLAPDPLNARIRCEGPDVFIPLAQAQAIGFVINELVTNSAKYGALSVAEGAVHVSWDVQPGGDGDQDVEVRWVERGGPPVIETPIPGVGSALVEGLATSELRGRADLSYPREGANHTLVMRLAETGTAQFKGPSMLASEAR